VHWLIFIAEQTTRYFSPREDIIKRISSEVRNQALQQVDILVTDLEAMEALRTTT
jgi:hypothetical protein